MDYGNGVHQGAGGYILGGPDFAIKYLRRLLGTVGVCAWEELPGKYIRVLHDGDPDSMNAKVIEISNLLDDALRMRFSEPVSE